ncbi:MAG: type ISP restriction/modification enzyme [Candidatus Brocadiia bacterium]
MTAKVFHAHLWGTREHKYAVLRESSIAETDWTELQPQSPFYLFVPRDTSFQDEYIEAPQLTDIVPLNGMGITTARDHFVIDYDQQPLLERAHLFCDQALSDRDACDKVGINLKKGWDVADARSSLRGITHLRALVEPVDYRPFDQRLILYHDAVVWRSVKQIMRHLMAGRNLALVTFRAIRELPWRHAFVASEALVKEYISSLDNCFAFPVYRYGTAKELFDDDGPWTPDEGGRVPNLSVDFVAALGQQLGVSFVPDGVGDLAQTFGPEDVFHYIYAVFHSPAYRERYAEFLKIDFPRVPLTADLDLFRSLCGLGADLVALHLLEDDYPHASWTKAGEPAPLADLVTSYPVAGDNTVEKGHPKYVPPGETPPGEDEPAEQGRVYISRTRPRNGQRGQYFEGVPPEVWAFHIGGYQVCEKWLKDRRGRQLSYEDLTHYQRVVVALAETPRLMAEVDEAIEAHGGWPIE